mmetsp:Transcript_18403/g.51948  ORF Transcript_18403/g.51948 Transcript_18403/m.51948 type:complete len:264 (+) Transcript_18403:100-891(+)
MSNQTEQTRKEYDEQAEEWKKIMNEEPIQHLVDQHSVLSRIEGIATKRVLDLATGEGRFARLYARAGCEDVVGLDLSEGQIAQATTAGSANIRYAQHDCTLPVPAEFGKFDVVTAHYLLCYAKEKSMLDAFFGTIINALRPGGLFLALNDNEEHIASDLAVHKDLGFAKTCDSVANLWTGMTTGQYPEGTTVTWNFFEPATFSSQVWIWHRATYLSKLKAAGFVDIEYLPISKPDTLTPEQSKLVDSFVTCPPIALIRARKPM